MHIRVLPTQVPVVWEAVKYAVVQLHEIPNEQLNSYCIWLLHELLTEKAQCWITLNDERMLLNISVTRIVDQEWTKERELHVHCMYAFQGLTDTTMAALIQRYMDFAKVEGCKRVISATRHPRVMALMEAQGLSPYYRTYVKEVEG